MCACVVRAWCVRAACVRVKDYPAVCRGSIDFAGWDTSSGCPRPSWSEGGQVSNHVKPISHAPRTEEFWAWQHNWDGTRRKGPIRPQSTWYRHCNLHAPVINSTERWPISQAFPPRGHLVAENQGLFEESNPVLRLASFVPGPWTTKHSTCGLNSEPSYSWGHGEAIPFPWFSDNEKNTRLDITRFHSLLLEKVFGCA